MKDDKPKTMIRPGFHINQHCKNYGHIVPMHPLILTFFSFSFFQKIKIVKLSFNIPQELVNISEKETSISTPHMTPNPENKWHIQPQIRLLTPNQRNNYTNILSSNGIKKNREIT